MPFVLLFLASCSSAPSPSTPHGENKADSAVPAERPAGKASKDEDSSPASAAAETTPAAGGMITVELSGCSAPTCRAHANLSSALDDALRDAPRFVAFGEAHKPAGFEGQSTVGRFTDELLPLLAPSASYLLVELLVPPKGCARATEAAREESAAITEGQSEQNQNEYVTLGHRARKLGVTPDILRASCSDMERIEEAQQHVDAPHLSVFAMMETIANVSAREAKRMLATSKDGQRVLLYGGALHNDVRPREGLEGWSYAAELSQHAQGAYVEVDLVVPELVKDTESWKKFAWYEPYARLPQNHPVVLLQTGKQSYALVFPRGVAN